MIVFHYYAMAGIFQSAHLQHQLEEIKMQKIRLEERLVQEQAAKDEMDEKYR